MPIPKHERERRQYRGTLARMMRENSAARRDLEDPEFTIDELAKMSGSSRSVIARLLLESGIGDTKPINGRSSKVVKLSELDSLIKEFKWL